MRCAISVSGQFRVRHHGDIVRIEIAREEMSVRYTPEMAAEFGAYFKSSWASSSLRLTWKVFRSGSGSLLQRGPTYPRTIVTLKTPRVGHFSFK